MTWGLHAHIVERFHHAGVSQDEITLVRDTFDFRLPGQGPAQVVDLFRRYYGPTMNAFAAAEQLHRELLAVARAQNRGGENDTIIPATFLRVMVQL